MSSDVVPEPYRMPALALGVALIVALVGLIAPHAWPGLAWPLACMVALLGSVAWGFRRTSVTEVVAGSSIIAALACAPLLASVFAVASAAAMTMDARRGRVDD